MSKSQSKHKKPFKVGQLVKHYKDFPHSGAFLVYDLKWRMPSQVWEVWYIVQRTGEKDWNWSINLRPIEERDDAEL